MQNNTIANQLGLGISDKKIIPPKTEQTEQMVIYRIRLFPGTENSLNSVPNLSAEEKIKQLGVPFLGTKIEANSRNSLHSFCNIEITFYFCHFTSPSLFCHNMTKLKYSVWFGFSGQKDNTAFFMSAKRKIPGNFMYNIQRNITFHNQEKSFL